MSRLRTPTPRAGRSVISGHEPTLTASNRMKEAAHPSAEAHGVLLTVPPLRTVRTDVSWQLFPMSRCAGLSLS